MYKNNTFGELPMFYDAELSFLQAILKNLQLNPVIISPGSYDMTNIDRGLRALLGLKEEYRVMNEFIHNKIKGNTIYKAKDSFFCHYIFLQLPYAENPGILMLGPYSTTEITKHSLMQLTEKYTIPTQIFSVIEKYFLSIPYVPNETLLMVLMNTFGEKIWGSTKNFTSEIYEFDYAPQTLQFSLNKDFTDNADLALNMQVLEERYHMENQFLQAISQGLTHKAEQVLAHMSSQGMEQRASDPVRNLQNYSIVMNTLLRKAAENGMVHPLYIDRLSSDFGRKIEAATTQEAVNKLQRDMIHKYCLLVKNHSMRGYSLLIQKVIIKIDSDLTVDLSLNALAEYLNVNPSYLSNLFKKETGSTLTEYVNRKRVEHGIFLLNSTTLQIQTIAQYCGIPDVNYFTKVFKKYYNKTPRDYRESILHGGG